MVSQKRQVIERAFALLKGRFRRFKFLDMSRLDLIFLYPSFIIAACVLHNICLEGINDIIEDFIEEGREPYVEENDHDREDQEYNDERHEFVDGEIKRNYLCLRIAGRQ